MKTKITSLLAAALAVSVFIGGCGSDTGDNPETAVTDALSESSDSVIYDADEEEKTLTKPCEAGIRIISDMPSLYINGESVVPVAYFGNTDIGTNVSEQAALAAKAGIHLHSVIYNLRYDDDYTDTSTYAYTNLNSCLDSIIKADPLSYIILRVNVGAYCDPASLAEGDWRLNGLIEYTDGSKAGLVSTASDKWAEEAALRLTKIVEYMRGSDKYSPHVACIHLERGEWFEYLFRESGSDVSEINSVKFREWLLDKYGGDAAFAEEWGVNYGIGEAEIPRDLPNNVSSDNSYPNTLMLDTSERRFVDYLDYINELVASRIDFFTKTVKDASGGSLLVIAFYGYIFELSDSQSGHYDMRALLDSEYIDGFAGPVTYADRTGKNGSVGATSAYMTVADSVMRNGKLWFSESDQRTFVNGSPDGGWLPNLTSLEDIYNVHRREVGMCMVHGGAMWAMDLMGTGWLLDAGIWNNLAELCDIYRDYVGSREKSPSFDVVFIVDEDAEAIAGQPSFNVSSKLLYETRLEACRAGISAAFAEIDDVLSGAFDDASLYIFLNPYRLSDGDAERLGEILHKNGKTSVFMYGFGALSSGSVVALTGMNIQSDESGTLNLRLTGDGKSAGFVKPSAAQEVSPRYYVKDGQSAVYAEYTGGGKSAFAKYDGEGWSCVFIGAIKLDSKNIRALCGTAGVNVISDEDDVVYACGDLIVYCAATAGKKTLSFGKNTNVYDIFDDSNYENVSEITVNFANGETRYFFLNN